MTVSAPANEVKTGGLQLLVPPEEKFWKRYSPHGEAPLSVVGAFSLHLLGIGGLALFALYLASLFFRPTQSLPIEPVRFGVGPGGTRGQPGGGEGNAAGIREAVDEGDPSKDSQQGLLEAPPRVSLNPAERARVEEKFDRDSSRYLAESNTEMSRKFARLDERLRKVLSNGLIPGAGPGPGGTDGKGKTGTGKDKGPGDGKVKLKDREKRMLRWHMRFTANTGPEYLAQLRGLGAILAIPEKEGAKPVYKVVRDLRKGAKLLDEDLAKIQRIYWIDDRPKSVKDIIEALGVDLPRTPSNFVAFMPQKLEDELYRMERDFVENVLKQKFVEDDVSETQFRVVRTATGYKAELVNVSMKQ